MKGDGSEWEVDRISILITVVLRGNVLIVAVMGTGVVIPTVLRIPVVRNVVLRLVMRHVEIYIGVILVFIWEDKLISRYDV